MGNFSINQFSGLEMRPTSLRVNYLIDMAEIPAFQEMQEHGLEPIPNLPRVSQYRTQKVQQLMRGLKVKVGQEPLVLSPRSSSVSFPTGVGGLPTLRISAIYEAPLPKKHGNIAYEDQNYRGRLGWKEIVASAHDGMTLTESSVPSDSKSNRLTAYDKNLLSVPPRNMKATLAFAVGATSKVLDNPLTASTVPKPRPEELATSLSDLIPTGPLDMNVVFLALLVATGLGAFHALEPGHGKTLVAAYLVGSKGTARHALLLGLIVTASHTAGVYALGALTLFASRYIVPEQLYPWLSFTSGILILFMGGLLLRRALKGRQNDHQHSHSHVHHGEHSERHEHPGEQENQALSHGALWTLGITGGMIPCPAALVVLLSTLALQQIYFGLLLIVAFSVGLAAVLVGIGLLVVSGGRFISHSGMEGRFISRSLPVASASVIIVVGLGMSLQSLTGAGLV